MNNNTLKNRILWMGALLALAVMAIAPRNAVAQDQYDDPPSRVARLGYMEGSVSFDPAGESDWVQAVPNRPMTIGDKLWADKDSRAEVQLGTATIRLAAETGMSFLNLDDRTTQIQLTSGSLNIRVRRLNRDEVFEIDTPNQAFSVYQPGRYRLEASGDGNYTVVSVREGEGESTGNGETFTLHAGQRGTFSGTDRLNAEVVDIGGQDQFDNWSYERDQRYERSRSARYLSRDVVGYEDLDDNGDWRDDPNYGHVWFPNRVDAGWAPYHDGHWAWVSPWGWTWVDDAPWGYAPFHYGRWISAGGRWGWVAGPVDVVPVYAPALVVFVGGLGIAGGNVAWFPLGPREVYVPTYNVSREYVNRVNITNTTVNTTTINNVYNTTIVNKSTTITNVTYVNRTAPGAVTAVPQHAFASAQPVAKAAVKVDERQIASAPVAARVAVAPSRESVLGLHANTANRVTAPPPAVANRQVIAKNTPPPPPVPFARQQQALAAHPGQPLAKNEVQNLRPTATAQVHPMVKMAPPGKPATPNAGPPGNQPGNRPNNQPAPNERPGAASPAQPNRPPAAQPNNRPEPNQPQPNNRPEPNQPNRPPAAQPNNRPEPNQPNRPPAEQPNNRPEPNQPNRPPTAQPNNRPEPNQPNRPPTAQPNNRPEPNQPNRPPAEQPNNRPEPNQPNRPPAAQPNNRPEPNQPNRPPAAQPNNRPEPSQPNRPPAEQPNNRPEPSQPNRPPAAQPNNRPEPNRPPAEQPNNRPEPNRTQPAARPEAPPPSERQQPQRTPPPETRQAPQQQRPPAQQQTPEEKKRQEEQRKKNEKPEPPQ
jgi:hypothetical protein